jgi:hypothetical protein
LKTRESNAHHYLFDLTLCISLPVRMHLTALAHKVRFAAWVGRHVMLTCCRNLCAVHAKRVTIMQKDIQLARRIRGPWAGLG